ncbi:MAG: class I mannose-6-phosphate isomerase [Planctomycetota bacterium]|jgi:mannose-6-phosphate isomerase|nr:class I mannose-6-phosphate isomerase [Planctomycetota bacterium]
MLQTPILFEPIAKRRVWGGSRLAYRFAERIDPPIGESWELSGVGGSSTKAVGAEYAGKTLEDLFKEDPVGLCGGKAANRYARFPLSVKLIDAGDDLPVQVAPNDEFARYKYGHGTLGGMEFWHIAAAGPGAKVYCGLSRNMSQDELRKSVARDELEKALNAVEVEDGDWLVVNPGILNAVGRNILLLSIQQASELSFRVYDWGRIPRKELDIENALLSANPNRFIYTVNKEGAPEQFRKLLTRNRIFSIERWTFKAGESIRAANESDAFFLLVALKGEMNAASGGRTVVLPHLGACLIPADSEGFEATASSGGSLLVATI